MNKILNRVIGAGLAVLMAIGGSVVAFAQETEQQRFDAYVESIPQMLIGGSSISLGYLYDDPSQVGIEAEDTVYTYTTKGDWDESYRWLAMLYNELAAFDAGQLDAQGRYTQYVLLDAIYRELLLKDYFYLDNDNLGSYLGAQASLPLLLAEYTIKDETQLKSYFNLLTTIPDAFKGYVQIEKERQQKGLGMNRDQIDAVIEQCDNLTEKDHAFLYDITNEKIDLLAGLSAQDKQAYKLYNEQLVEGYIIKAYKDLRAELAKMRSSAPKEGKGLASKTGGKAYYAALLRRDTGVDMTPDEAMVFLEARFDKAFDRLFDVYRVMIYEEPYVSMDVPEAYTHVYDAYQDGKTVIEYATQQAKKDYPDIGRMNYRIEQVPEAMKDNFSPAAFISPALDKSPDEPNIIYLNLERSAGTSNAYQTLIHEGVPGHMYQAEYYAKQNMPDAITLMANDGYIEGWATYVEMRSHELVKPVERPMVEMDNIDDEMNMLLMGMIDIGVNYLGWNQAQLKAFIMKKFEMTPTDESVAGIYNQVLETPCNSLTYILPAEILTQLREEAEAKLGSQFSAKEFHQVILSCGPTSMTNVQAQVRAYIDEKLGSSQNAAA